MCIFNQVSSWCVIQKFIDKLALRSIIPENVGGAIAMGRLVIPLKMTEEERKEPNEWPVRRRMPAGQQQ
tara:strand:- start:1684 stop:1890 length:207 start_codon:yes stop_codon:yes gene_type:complete